MTTAGSPSRADPPLEIRMATPIDRGPGSRSADFTAPSVPVVTPGRQIAPQQTDFDRFRDAVVGAGRGVAAAVSARATINNRLKALKEQSVSRVEADLGRSAVGLQQKRLDRAAMQRTQVMAEAGSRGMEWAERQFRSAMVNAGSAQESRMWEQAWTGAAGQVSRENAEAKQQAFNSASRTMRDVSRSLQQEIGADPKLQQELIGDGSNIGARVQDWMLQQVAGSLDLDSMDEESADLLIHQTVQNSFSISDSLIGVHSEQVRASNETLGSQQIESDIFSTVANEQGSGRLRAQLEVTMRDKLSHLTMDQQRDFARRSIESQLQEMASGTHGIDAVSKLGVGADMLNIAINGERLFSERERQTLATAMINSARSTVGRYMDSEIEKLRESQTQVVSLPDGSTVHRPSANADALLITPDPITGLTPIEEAGNRMLANLGLLGVDPMDLSPEAALLVGEVRSRTMRAAEDNGRATAVAQRSAANQRAVYQGSPGGDANEAYRDSVQRRALMTPDGLTAEGQTPPSAEETRFLKQTLLQMGGNPEAGIDMEAVRGWDGGPVEWTEENRGLISAIQKFDAAQWSHGPTQDLYGIPSAVVEEKTALLRSDDPLRIAAWADWATGLRAGTGGAWSNYLDDLSPNERAAATLVRTLSLYGSGPQSTATDPQRLVGQVQAILAAPAVGTWFSRSTGEPTDKGAANISSMATTFSQAIKASHPDAKFKGQKSDPLSRQLTAQIDEMLQSTSGNGRTLRDLFAAGSAANPDLSPEQVSTMVWGWMQKAGWQFRQMGDRQALVIDPQGYTGEQGDNITETISTNLTRPFSPSYRAFLADALGGLSPKKTPVNLQDLYIQRSDVPPGIDPTVEGAFLPRYGFDDTVQNRLTKSRAAYGGFEFRLQTSDGTDLGNVVTQRSATLQWPDGTSVYVPAGTPLNVINPDIFLDSDINVVGENSLIQQDAERAAIREGLPASSADDTVQQAALRGYASLVEPQQAAPQGYPTLVETRRAPSLPANLNELAKFLPPVDETSIRPGPRVEATRPEAVSGSIFNQMATLSDEAAHRSIGFVGSLGFAPSPEEELHRVDGTTGNVFKEAGDTIRSEFTEALKEARENWRAGGTARRDAATRRRPNQ